MKSLVLAEKPSVAKELARVLGCRKSASYYEGADYVVTWALGHLVTLCPPDHYGEKYKHWRLSSLPMLPEKLDTMVIEKTQDQFNTVKSLLDREDVESVVIATDAGREGELVARWILGQAECKKPCKRLWISSQTDMAIKQGFANLKDASEYDSLFNAAQSRSYADWYIGYNVSRAMSIHFDARLSAGRVQTPTLSLITQREDEIEAFAGKFYYTIKADFGSFKASWYSPEGTIRIDSEDAAKALEDKLSGAKGAVKTLTEVPKTEKPPLAYDLTELQRDANKLLGFSAKETLDTLQRLYEVHKIVTYPRTDSRYITADIVPTIPDRLAALSATPFANRVNKMLTSGIRQDLSRLVNDAEVSDHHALLPTEQKVDLSKLTEKEKALWELVITRFLETLSGDYNYKTTTLEADVQGERFIARLTVPVEDGWRDVARDVGRRSAVSVDTEEDKEEGLRSLTEGSELEIKSLSLKKNNTIPPERYTEADLLYAMEHAGRLVEDTELKKHLANGLGTPATRADIIEKLIQNSCIERKDKYLVPTAKGRELVRLVPEQLKSARLTGLWEERLSKISSGKEEPDGFISDIKTNASELVKEVLNDKDEYNPALMGDEEKKCPSCGWPMVKVIDEEGTVHYVCQRFSCGYEEKLHKKTIGDKTMTAKVVVKESHYRRPEERFFRRFAGGEGGERRFGDDEHRRTGENGGKRYAGGEKERRAFVGGDRGGNDSERGKRSAERGVAAFNRATDVTRPYRESYSGGTFADFIRASEERKNRDREKKKKK